jgi:hypothetical protein
MAWISVMILDPFAQNIPKKSKVPRRLSDRHTPLQRQPDGLKRAFADERLSLHHKPSVPSSTP